MMEHKEHSLAGKTLVISGASRGIGLAIAQRAARDGANVVIFAKSSSSNGALNGTVQESVELLTALGAHAVGVVADIRDEDAILGVVDTALREFGGIDVCINNASALALTDIGGTSAKKFDLIHQVNSRGTFLLSQACLPALLASKNGHIVTLSPPITLTHPPFLGEYTAYMMSKFSMTLATLGIAAQYGEAISANTLWPKTLISTAAVEKSLGGEAAFAGCRKAEIVADAVHLIVSGRFPACSGQSLIDEDVLRDCGVTNFDHYAHSPGALHMTPDYFLVP